MKTAYVEVDATTPVTYTPLSTTEFIVVTVHPTGGNVYFGHTPSFGDGDFYRIAKGDKLVFINKGNPLYFLGDDDSTVYILEM